MNIKRIIWATKVGSGGQLGKKMKKIWAVVRGPKRQLQGIMPELQKLMGELLFISQKRVEKPFFGFMVLLNLSDWDDSRLDSIILAFNEEIIFGDKRNRFEYDEVVGKLELLKEHFSNVRSSSLSLVKPGEEATQDKLSYKTVRPWRSSRTTGKAIEDETVKQQVISFLDEHVAPMLEVIEWLDEYVKGKSSSNADVKK